MRNVGRAAEPAEVKQLASDGVRGSRPSAMDPETLRALVEIIEKSDITRIEWRRGDERLMIRRGPPAPRQAAVTTLAPVAPVAQLTAVAPLTPVAPAPPAAPAPAPTPASAAAAATEAKVHVATSPFVGTFYRAPSPDASPFVEVGQTVKKGQVVCIVEAMKLMNEIESEVAGKLVEVLVQNGHPVEFGQPLFKIEVA